MKSVFRNFRRVPKKSKRSNAANGANDYTSLETRQLLATFHTLSAGILTITGTSDADTIIVNQNPNDPTDTGLVFTTNGVTTYHHELTNDITKVVVNAGDGNDTIRMNHWKPTEVFGEGGDDYIVGSYVVDTLYGDAGIDRLYGRAGNDDLHGGDGDDTLYSGPGNDTAFGDDGSDKLYSMDGGDTSNGGAGDDFLYGNVGIDTLYGGAGSDIVRGGSNNDFLYGGNGPAGAVDNSYDYIRGDAGDDTIYGDGGNDRLFGDGEADSLNGGDGDDLMYGGDGNDLLYGDAGNDTLRGEDGADSLYGLADDDNLYGGYDGSNDFHSGGTGADRSFYEVAIDSSDHDVTSMIDAMLVLQNDDLTWSDSEVEDVNSGLQLLYDRTGNNLLAQNRISYNGELKTVTYLINKSLAPNVLATNFTPGGQYGSTRVIQFADVAFTSSIYSPESVVVHEFAHNWHEYDLYPNFSPGVPAKPSDFYAISDWRGNDPGTPDYTQSASGEWYLSSAEFADEYGKYSRYEDWATAWQHYFTVSTTGTGSLGDKLDVLDHYFSNAASY